MKKLLLLFVLLLSYPLFACDYTPTIEPQRPTSRDDIAIALRGGCSDGCIPLDPNVEISGNRITISLSNRGGCILIPVEWGERVKVGRLRAGTYEVVVRFNDQPATAFPLVVESAPFSIAPTFGPAGTRVVIRNLDLGFCTEDPCVPNVSFGGVAAENVQSFGTTILATAPAHAPGPVNVTVEDFAGHVHTATNAFRYDERNGFSGEWDRVMFPLHYEGPGALGARWNTVITVRNDAPVDTWSQPTLKNPLLRPGERASFPTEAKDGGAFLYVPRGLEAYLSYESRILDESKTQSTIGTEVRVIRAEDTSSVIELVNVRAGEGYRALLRIYDFDATFDRDVHLTIRRPDGTRIDRGVRLSGGIVCVVAPCLQPNPTFANVDLSGIAEVQGAASVDISLRADTNDARLWAFVSVTNNETQQVTLWTPQHAPRVAP